MKNELKDHLAGLPSGPVEDPRTLEFLLAQEWRSFRGSREGGMEGGKIIGRTEQMQWQPPCLTFFIERHGAMANGSTRAELQGWEVDVSSWAAQIVAKRRRQMRSTAKRVVVRGIAEEIAEAILNNRESPMLKWHPDGRVAVRISAVIPADGFKQTIAGRRKRFRAALESLISERGWLVAGTNIYQQKPEP